MKYDVGNEYFQSKLEKCHFYGNLEYMNYMLRSPLNACCSSPLLKNMLLQ
jgi:hypothetical protein